MINQRLMRTPSVAEDHWVSRTHKINFNSEYPMVLTDRFDQSASISEIIDTLFFGPPHIAIAGKVSKIEIKFQKG